MADNDVTEMPQDFVGTAMVSMCPSGLLLLLVAQGDDLWLVSLPIFRSSVHACMFDEHISLLLALLD